METKKSKMAVKENENKLEQGAFLPQCNASHFADDIFRKWYFFSWNGTALTVVYVEGNHFICDLFILSFECNDGEMCPYHDLRCESLGKYEGKVNTLDIGLWENGTLMSRSKKTVKGTG